MPRQIGWSQESNLLYDIATQLDKLLTVAGGGGGLLAFPSLAAFPPVGDPCYLIWPTVERFCTTVVLRG